MSFDTNWDIDKHKEDHESDDHWLLRRSFMERWKQSFPEERLVCLGRVFSNIEFMGCRYPQEVMLEVARMSKEVNAKNNNAERSNHNFDAIQSINQDTTATANSAWLGNALQATQSISQPVTEHGYDNAISNQMSAVENENMWGKYSSDVQDPISTSKVLQTPLDNQLNQTCGNADNSTWNMCNQKEVQLTSSQSNFVNNIQGLVNRQNPETRENIFSCQNLSWRNRDPRLNFSNTTKAVNTYSNAAGYSKALNICTAPSDDGRFVLYPKEKTYQVKFYKGERIAKEVVKLIYRKSLKKRIAIYTIGNKGGICRKALPETKKKHIRWWMDQGMTIEEALLLSLRPYQEIYEETLQGKHSQGTRISINNLLEQIKNTGNLNRAQDDDEMSSDVSDVDDEEIPQQEVQSIECPNSNTLHPEQTNEPNFYHSGNTDLSNNNVNTVQFGTHTSLSQDQNEEKSYDGNGTHKTSVSEEQNMEGNCDGNLQEANNYWSQHALNDSSPISAVHFQIECEPTHGQNNFENPIPPQYDKSLPMSGNSAKLCDKTYQEMGPAVSRQPRQRCKKVKLTQAGKRRLHFWLHVGKSPAEARILSQMRLSKFPEYKQLKQKFGSCRKYGKEYNKNKIMGIVGESFAIAKQQISNHSKNYDATFKSLPTRNAQKDMFHEHNTNFPDFSSNVNIHRNRYQGPMLKDGNTTEGIAVYNNEPMRNITTVNNIAAATAAVSNTKTSTAAVSNTKASTAAVNTNAATNTVTATVRKAGATASNTKKTDMVVNNTIKSIKRSKDVKVLKRFHTWINIGKTPEQALKLCQKQLKDIPMVDKLKVNPNLSNQKKKKNKQKKKLPIQQNPSLANQLKANPELANKSNYLMKMAEKECGMDYATKIPHIINTLNSLQPKTNETNIAPTIIKIFDSKNDGNLAPRQEKIKSSIINSENAGKTNKNANHLKICIKDSNKIIQKSEINALKDAIRECIGDNKEINMPTFGRITGCAVLNCADVKSRDWLDKEIPTLLPWEGAQLEVINESDIPQSYNAYITIPNVPECESTCLESDELLKKINEQNPGVGSENWKIISSQIKKGGQHLLIHVDEKSLHFLKTHSTRLKWFNSIRLLNVKLMKELVIGQKNVVNDPISKTAQSVSLTNKNQNDSTRIAEDSPHNTIQPTISKASESVIDLANASTLIESSSYSKMAPLGCYGYLEQTKLLLKNENTVTSFIDAAIPQHKTVDSSSSNSISWFTEPIQPTTSAIEKKQYLLEDKAHQQDIITEPKRDSECLRNSSLLFQENRGDSRQELSHRSIEEQKSLTLEHSKTRDNRIENSLLSSVVDFWGIDTPRLLPEHRAAITRKFGLRNAEHLQKDMNKCLSEKEYSNQREESFDVRHNKYSFQEVRTFDGQEEEYSLEERVFAARKQKYLQNFFSAQEQSFSQDDRISHDQQEYCRENRVITEHEQINSGSSFTRTDQYSKTVESADGRSHGYSQQNRVLDGKYYPERVVSEQDDFSRENRVLDRSGEYSRNDNVIVNQDEKYSRNDRVLVGQDEECYWKDIGLNKRGEEFSRDDKVLVGQDEECYWKDIGLDKRGEEYSRDDRVLAGRNENYYLEDRDSTGRDKEYSRENSVLDKVVEYSRDDRVLVGRDEEYSRDKRVVVDREEDRVVFGRDEEYFRNDRDQNEEYYQKNSVLNRRNKEYSRGLGEQNEKYSWDDKVLEREQEYSWERRDSPSREQEYSREDRVLTKPDEVCSRGERALDGRIERYQEDRTYDRRDHGHGSTLKDKVFDERDERYSRENRVVTIREHVYTREARIFSRQEQEYYPKNSGFGKRHLDYRDNKDVEKRNRECSRQDRDFAGLDKYSRKGMDVTVREEYSRQKKVQEYCANDRDYYKRKGNAHGSCIFVEDRVGRRDTGSDTNRCSNDRTAGWHSQASTSSKNSKKKRKRNRGRQDGLE